MKGGLPTNNVKQVGLITTAGVAFITIIPAFTSKEMKAGFEGMQKEQVVLLYGHWRLGATDLRQALLQK